MLRTLRSKVGTTAAKVVVRPQRLPVFIQISSESPIERTMACVPLDMMRPDATRQRRQRLMLSAHKPGILAELLGVCGMLCTLHRHPGNTLTIPSNMEIHHALMRVFYGSSYVTRNIHRYLKYLPQVYGIWHPYKYTPTLVCKRYLRIIACLLFLNLTTEISVLVQRKVPFMEKVVAALLVARSDFIVPIQDITTRLEAQRKRYPLAIVVAVHKLKALQRQLPNDLCIGSRCAGMYVGMQEYWDRILSTPGFA